MGYTHYWYRPQEIDSETFRRIRADFEHLLPHLAAAGVILADGMGEGEPVITPETVTFNGARDCGHPENHEVSIPWPEANAGGISTHADITGHWWAGAMLQTRACNGDCSYETFHFPRLRPADEWAGTCGGGLVFDCIKTAFRPYDLAVTAFLVIASRHIPALIVRSDGTDANWFDAKHLCMLHLGYGHGFTLADERPADDPAPVDVARASLLVKHETAKETAARIRKALKAEFPGVKFSVRSETFAGGDAVRVGWTDGPTSADVEAVCNRFSSYEFDGMTDTGTYTGFEVDGVWIVGAKYISCTRELSDAYRARIENKLREKFAEPPTHAGWPLHWWQEAEAEIRFEDALALMMSTPDETTDTSQAPATFTRSGDWSWLKFKDKPAPEVLDSLKANGWRWSRKRGAWYHMGGAEPPAGVA